MKPNALIRTLAATAIAALLAAAPAARAVTTAEVDGALAAAKTYDYGQTRENLVRISDLIRAAREEKTSLPEVEKRLAAFLESDATLAAKQFVCVQLGYIGSDASVPALVKLVGDDKTADMARMALERIPGKKANEALLAALNSAKGATLAGIVNSLGERRAKEAAKPLAKLLEASDATVASAAAAALGKIGGKHAVDALETARAKAPAAAHAAFDDAVLSAADQMLAAGEKAPAQAIYSKVLFDTKIYVDTILAARSAAFIGLIRSGADVWVHIAANLKAEPTMMSQVLFPVIRTCPKETPTKALAGLLPELAPAMQIQLIAALEDRGDKDARKAIVDVAKSSKDNLARAAAIAALAKIGDDSDVPLLAAAAAGQDKEPKESAEFSLSRLAAKGTDEALLKHLGSAPEPEKIAVIKAIAARNAASALPALFTEAKGSSQRVRVEAIRALGEVAPPKSLNDLVALQLACSDPAEQAEIEKAVVATARRSPEGQPTAATPLAALEKAGSDPAKASLFRVLGMLGDPAGLAPLKGALTGSSDDLRTAAIKAISEWPDTAPIDDLLNAAKSSPAPAQQLLAWRGFIKLASLKEKGDAAGALANYKTALESAQDDGIKRLVLSRVGGMTSGGALRIAASQMDSASLRAEAEAATLKITGKMKPEALAKAKDTLQKLAESGSTDDVKKQAAELLKKAGG